MENEKVLILAVHGEKLKDFSIELVQCPYCGSWSRPRAKVCKGCGGRFQLDKIVNFIPAIGNQN
jgi:uncharacterized OB-fold protein